MPSSAHIPAGLIGALLLALVVRLAAATLVERRVATQPGRVCLIGGDADGYWELGRKLAHGEDYQLYDPPRRVLRMPGLPLLLAGFQTLLGESTWPARLGLAVIGALGCVLVYWLGRELTDPASALLAAWATALSPALVGFSVLILSETPFAVAMTASLLALARLFRDDAAASGRARWRLAAVAGALIALATYMRPTWLPAAPLAAAGLLFARRGQGRGWWEAAALLAAFVLALAPWTWRNYLVTQHFVPTTLWVGPSLYDGLRPGATGDSEMTFFEQDRLLDRMSEYDMDREYRRRAWAFVSEHPGRTLELALIKAGRYWNIWPNAAEFQQPALAWPLLLGTAPLYLGALCGLWFGRRDGRLWLLCAGPAVFFGAVHMLFVGSIRYRLPAEYPLWVLAASGLVHGWRRLTAAAANPQKA